MHKMSSYKWLIDLLVSANSKLHKLYHNGGDIALSLHPIVWKQLADD